MPMASRLEVRVEVRDCAKFVKVVIEKVDDRNAERIMRTEIQDRFVIKSPPTDVPVISYIGQFLKKKKKKMEKFRNFRTGLSRYCWGYF